MVAVPGRRGVIPSRISPGRLLQAAQDLITNPRSHTSSNCVPFPFFLLLFGYLHTLHCTNEARVPTTTTTATPLLDQVLTHTGKATQPRDQAEGRTTQAKIATAAFLACLKPTQISPQRDDITARTSIRSRQMIHHRRPLSAECEHKPLHTHKKPTPGVFFFFAAKT